MEFCVFFCDVQQNTVHLDIIGWVYRSRGGSINMIIMDLLLT